MSINIFFILAIYFPTSSKQRLLQNKHNGSPPVGWESAACPLDARTNSPSVPLRLATPFRSILRPCFSSILPFLGFLASFGCHCWWDFCLLPRLQTCTLWKFSPAKALSQAFDNCASAQGDSCARMCAHVLLAHVFFCLRKATPAKMVARMHAMSNRYCLCIISCSSGKRLAGGDFRAARLAG